MLGTSSNIIDRIGCVHLCAFVALLPFDRFYSELILISFMLHTLVHFKRDHFKKLLCKEFLITALLFLLVLTGTLYSHYPTEAKNDVEKQSAFILLPFLFAMFFPDLKKYSPVILYSLVFSCIGITLYLYMHTLGVMQFYHMHLKELFSVSFINHNFSAPIEMHATILSMYISFSIFILLYDYYKKRTSGIWYLLGILILGAGLVQLASKTVIIATLIIANLAFPMMLTSKKKYLFILTSILLSAIIIFQVVKLDSLRDRFITSLQNDLTQSSINNEIMEPRIERWRIAIGLIKKAPLTGYGTGSEIPILKQAYFDQKLYNAYLKELNTHNQYISFMLKYGIAGLLVYLLILGFGLYTAFRKKDILFISFLVIIIIVGTAENFLDVNKGIFFFSFFYSFFIFYNKKYFTPVPDLNQLKEQPIFLDQRFNIKETIQ
ncbi:MAG: hypothetical protein JWN76_1108 [Chitinophagaceae bacterium]|nr:hypothetical protein [Chitinophagaceae bacterium]